MIKNIIAVLLITYGLLGNSVFDILDTPTPTPVPIPAPVLQIEEPSDSLKTDVVPVAATVTNKDDRVELAVFFLELSERLPRWDLSLQQLNDVIVSAAQQQFKNRLNGKYDGFDEGLTRIVIDITGNKVHVLSAEEKTKLSKAFKALAWALVQG